MHRLSSQARILQSLLISVLLMAFIAPANSQEETKSDFKTDYVSLGKPMVLNLSSNRTRLTFLQLTADMQVDSEQAKETAENFLPVFRHILILKLSEQDAQAMKTPQTREALRAEISQQMIDTINELADASDIKEVLFSQFLVQ